jgi:hypothetical protein
MDRGLALLEDILGEIGMKMAATPARALASLAWQRALLGVRGLGFRERHESELPATQLRKIDVAGSVSEGLGTADPIRAADLHARHLRLALAAGEPRRVCRALVSEASFLSASGIAMEARVSAIVRRVDELAARLGGPEMLGLAAGCRGVTALNMGQFREASTWLARAEQIFRDQCTGHRWEIATAHIYGLYAAVLLGRVSEVIHRLPVLLDEAAARGDLYTATTLETSLGFYVPLAEDDPAGAQRAVEAALARWSQGGFHLQHANALNSLAYVDLYQGESERALARVRKAWPDVKSSLLLRVEVMRSLLVSLRGRSALAEGARAGDRRLVDEADALGEQLGGERSFHCSGNGLSLRTCVAMIRGDRARAAELFDAALRQLERAELQLNIRMLHHAYGRFVGGTSGAAMVEEAEAWMKQEGLRAPARIVRMFCPLPKAIDP